MLLSFVRPSIHRGRGRHEPWLAASRSLAGRSSKLVPTWLIDTEEKRARLFSAVRRTAVLLGDAPDDPARPSSSLRGKASDCQTTLCRGPDKPDRSCLHSGNSVYCPIRWYGRPAAGSPKFRSPPGVRSHASTTSGSSSAFSKFASREVYSTRALQARLLLSRESYRSALEPPKSVLMAVGQVIATSVHVHLRQRSLRLLTEASRRQDPRANGRPNRLRSSSNDRAARCRRRHWTHVGHAGLVITGAACGPDLQILQELPPGNVRGEILDRNARLGGADVRLRLESGLDKKSTSLLEGISRCDILIA